MVKAKLIGHNTNWELTIIVKHRKCSTVIYHKVTNEQKRPKRHHSIFTQKMYHNEEICGSKSNKKTGNTKYILCCMSREKVSISLDKDEKSLRTFNLQHMVKALPLTSWHLTNFCKTH